MDKAVNRTPLKQNSHSDKQSFSRRSFVKKVAIGSAGVTIGVSLFNQSNANPFTPGKSLADVSYNLLKTWCDTLISYQVNDAAKPGLHGGILCPACARIHGRCGDAIYPMLYMAQKTGDEKYLRSARLLFEWMEQNVSLPNGSWVNDVNVSKWNGITVFGAISLGEAILNHGELLPRDVKEQWLARLQKAAEFIHLTFHIEYSNVNYPVTGTYALFLMGKIFNDKRYFSHAEELAQASLRFFTPKDKFLFGEGGGDRYTLSPKGCLPVDLGYNVEESLPALALYGLENQNEEILELVTESLGVHMEFMLPDGAWDNSWGTRSFKWTYWGSRTSDGCQTAYALLADRNPVFYKAALQNTLLLQNCTHNGLLHGGPQYHTHGVLPCIHHTFCHAKALAAILDHGPAETAGTKELKLPREQHYGIKKFEDIQTWLVSNKSWAATITGYDREYKFKNGHPSGGALTLLYHRTLGPVLVSSMNQYQLIEATNMQAQYDPYSMSLTPRLQTKDGKYMNISDLAATVEAQKSGDTIAIHTKSKLVDGSQQKPQSGEIACKISWFFSEEAVKIKVAHDASETSLPEFVLPLISNSEEDIRKLSDRKFLIKKAAGNILVEADRPIKKLPVLEGKKRIFNHVPGMEAIPFALEGREINITLTTTK
ncbi:twin-arginine translocation signal domain-containing protein [Mariniphaga sediminis]|uniref:Twin-arginine translocation signal domain-containing protein n=1 Tax=Mariniphaga sediminis TaxID=1628158 RepID=A0A399CW14_9BACT|nr:twin-arginine translocation signal domain-containing protein [Mariniphaga sediminis]RIH63945.1 twin-arginine translocation signal domain-containing protein [Mariniphaga sediminis]